MFDKMFSNVSLLKKGLDASWLKNEVISNNVANVDTPGFKSSSVDFESVFKDALDGDSDFVGFKTREGHIDIGVEDVSDLNAKIIQNNETSMKLDGNNVDIDSEMTELAKNTIYYNMLSIKVSKELGRIRMAITEGK